MTTSNVKHSVIGLLVRIEDASVPQRIVGDEEPASSDATGYCVKHCRIACLIDIVEDQIEFAGYLRQRGERVADVNLNAVRDAYTFKVLACPFRIFHAAVRIMHLCAL